MSDNKESRGSLERMLPHYASFSDEEKKQVLMEGGVPADTPDVLTVDGFRKAMLECEYVGFVGALGAVVKIVGDRASRLFDKERQGFAPPGLTDRAALEWLMTAIYPFTPLDKLPTMTGSDIADHLALFMAQMRVQYERDVAMMKRVVLETIAAVRKQRTADDEKRG